jgi:hypothetical protein
MLSPRSVEFLCAKEFQVLTDSLTGGGWIQHIVNESSLSSDQRIRKSEENM